MVAVTLAITALLAVATGVSAAPAVFASGEFSTPGTYYLDLDHGQVTTNSDTADGWYQIDSGGHRLFTPVHAEVVKFGASKPTYRQCKNAMVGGASWDMNQNQGKWFCALTNKGRVNRFQVISATNDQLILKFTTWS
jgi:alkyl hydroperoxide reductase subunit AhpC